MNSNSRANLTNLDMDLDHQISKINDDFDYDLNRHTSSAFIDIVRFNLNSELSSETGESILV